MISAISNSPMISPLSYGSWDEREAESPVNEEDRDTENGGLTAEEERIVTDLKKTDAKVRQHEMAHMAAGGSLVTSGASYTYETGPDGARYAVGGEVGIDSSKGSTSEETAQKAKRIRAAALAPADPSPQDRSVAAMASQMEMQALQEIAQRKMAESRGDGEKSGKENADRSAQSGVSGGVKALALAAYKSMTNAPGRLGNLGGLSGGLSAYA